ncbi:MAG: class I SAM-dependent methyltransferase [Actinomycetota bacterium]
MRFERSSIPEIGRFLAVLVATRSGGRFAEIGTGTGVGSAWIADAMGPEATLVTTELDDDRAAAASRLFDDHPNVRVLHGDWHELLPPEAPFDLLFFDGGYWKQGDVPAESNQVLELMAWSGIVVIDDLTPESLWPEEWRGRADPPREFWLGHDGVLATELLVTPESAAILAVKR